MTLQDFINKYSGKGIDFDNYYGFQCMDLAHQYAVEVVGKDFPGQPTAKDVWNLTIDGYSKITNSPEAVPSPGDIVIWGTGVGASGHIAVFVSGDVNAFKSFDQNWPLGSVCHIQDHNYNYVLGWFHPLALQPDTIAIPKETFENLVKKSSEDDLYRALGFGSPEEVRIKIANLQSDNASLNATVTSLNSEIEALQDKVAHLPPYGVCHDDDIRPLVNGIGLQGWYLYLRSRSAIQGLLV